MGGTIYGGAVIRGSVIRMVIVKGTVIKGAVIECTIVEGTNNEGPVVAPSSVVLLMHCCWSWHCHWCTIMGMFEDRWPSNDRMHS